MQKLTQCIKCVHRTKGGKCLAYPGGIPYKVISGEILHNQVFDDQVCDYVYTPKTEYIEHDLKIKKGYSISLSDIKNLKTEVAQLYYSDLYSQEFIKENWESARLDFEFLPNKYGGKFNELSINICGNTTIVNQFPSSELTEKLLFLLKIKANQLKCTRVVFTIFPKFPAIFEFV